MALRFRRLAGLLPPVALVALIAGCPGRTDVLQTSQHLTLQPSPGGTFNGYTGTSFDHSIDQSKRVHLLDLTMSSSTGEFSWASSVTGSASSDMSEVIVTKSSLESATGTTSFDIVDTGDLRSLFPSGNSFRIYWSVAFASAFAQAYPDGVVVTLNYTIEID